MVREIDGHRRPFTGTAVPYPVIWSLCLFWNSQCSTRGNDEEWRFQALNLVLCLATWKLLGTFEWWSDGSWQDAHSFTSPHTTQCLCLFLHWEVLYCQRNDTCRSSLGLSVPYSLLAEFFCALESCSQLYQLSNQGRLSILQIHSHHAGGIGGSQKTLTSLEYTCALAVCAGLVLFAAADWKHTPSFRPIGLIQY